VSKEPKDPVAQFKAPEMMPQSDPDQRLALREMIYGGSADSYLLEAHTGAWAVERFGGPERLLPNLQHMRRELREYADALGAGDYAKAVEELADLRILIEGAASGHGLGLFPVSVTTAYKRKMVENLRRKWQPPDSEGVIEHVRSPSEVVERINSMLLGPVVPEHEPSPAQRYVVTLEDGAIQTIEVLGLFDSEDAAVRAGEDNLSRAEVYGYHVYPVPVS
jgi:hypothetical protein